MKSKLLNLAAFIAGGITAICFTAHDNIVVPKSTHRLQEIVMHSRTGPTQTNFVVVPVDFNLESN